MIDIFLRFTDFFVFLEKTYHFSIFLLTLLFAMLNQIQRTIRNGPLFGVNSTYNVADKMATTSN